MEQLVIVFRKLREAASLLAAANERPSTLWISSFWPHVAWGLTPRETTFRSTNIGR